VYPGLEMLFDESSWRACPTIVSLGDKGYYYVRVGTQWKYSLPRTIPTTSKIGKESGGSGLVATMHMFWRGLTGLTPGILRKSHVSLTTRRWSYISETGLTVVRQLRCVFMTQLLTTRADLPSPNQDLAMNIEIPTRYIIIFTDGSARFWLDQNTEKGAHEFTKRNCGTKWS
jgi:hypothetical protein